MRFLAQNDAFSPENDNFSGNFINVTDAILLTDCFSLSLKKCCQAFLMISYQCV